jgi:hypothetical protein
MRRLIGSAAAALLAAPLLLVAADPARAALGPEVVKVWLVNAATGDRIDELTDYETLDLAFLPATLSVEAEVDGKTSSVRFAVDNVVVRTENGAPYALGGDTNGTFAAVARLRQGGWVDLRATPFANDNAAGTAGPVAIRRVYLRQPDFVVSSTSDLKDAKPGDGSCASPIVIVTPPGGFTTTAAASPAAAPGPVVTAAPKKTGCTLRAAIEEANALPGRQTISIDGTKGVYKLTKGQLQITGDVDLNGYFRPVVDAQGTSQTMYIGGTPADELLVNISNVELANGEGQTSIERGGNLFIEYALLQLSRSVVRGGQGNFGGGIYLQNGGDLTLDSSIVRDNWAGHPANFGGGGQTQRGGGIYNLDGNVLIRHSSIVDNHAVRGGGIANGKGTVRIEDSSIIGNEAASQGGGIENLEQGGVSPKLHISFSTITNNKAGVSNADPQINRTGGGLYNTGTAFVASSIIAQNTDGLYKQHANYSPDCWSLTTYDAKSYRNNVVGILNANCKLGDYSSGTTAFMKVGTPDAPLDPKLLSRNGGGGNPVYRTPIAGSPALDYGGGSGNAIYPCPSRDVRNYARPAGAGCDAGSAERQ